MIVDLPTLTSRERYQWMISTIVPRPIAFVSTISAAGEVNLAPFSYFNGVSSSPPLISVAVGPKAKGAEKDTLRNAEETGELVVNIVTESMAEAMVLCSGDYPPDVNEFDVSGFSQVTSVKVGAPRVLESPIALECKLQQIVRVGVPETALLIAQVVLLHVREEILTDGFPDVEKLRPLARLGGDLYAALGELRRIPRPKVE